MWQGPEMAIAADATPSPALPLIPLIPPQPLHQGLMGSPMVAAHQKGPQTPRIGETGGRMLAQTTQLDYHTQPMRLGA